MAGNSDRVELDVLFYIERNLHLPFLEPVHDYLKKTYPHLNMGFSASAYVPSTRDIPGAGISGGEAQRLDEKSCFYPRASQVQAKVAVVADTCHFSIPHIPRVVNVGHGLICKGFYYTTDPVVRRENLSTLICVPGPWHKERLRENVFVPIVATGFIKSDLLFKENSVDRHKFCHDFGIDPDNKIILFAPTYNEEFSSIPWIQQDIECLAGAGRTVLIKLHNMTDPQWMDMYRDLARDNSNIFYLEDADYSGMMHASDVMISDVSSIFIEFMLMDKPVVLFNSPHAYKYPSILEDDLEYLVRDAVQEAGSLPDLFSEVEKALTSPDRLSPVRQKYIENLDYGRDGQSAKRAGEAIYPLIDFSRRQSAGRPEYSVFLRVEDQIDQKTLLDCMEEIITMAMNARLEIFVVSDVPGCVSLDFGFPPKVYSQGKTPLLFHRALSLAKGQMAVLMSPGWNLQICWPKWLRNHFGWHENVGLVKMLSDSGTARAAIEATLPGADIPLRHEVLSSALLYMMTGKSSSSDRLKTPCAMTPLPVLKACAREFHRLFQGDIIANLEALILDMGLQSLTALETYIYPQGEEFIIRDESTLMDAVN
ncbi:MAG: CDP-glycerol glycerophosphotransferase family protein, partial [Desulfonatronovibrio sp.]